ncbi:MAG TPA: hypothetical protein PLT86_12380, partial [Candidatus Latescibacteria bacterium]|nr:hypothetical protein [Candidatus Latescibacterota bacterium]
PLFWPFLSLLRHRCAFWGLVEIRAIGRQTRVQCATKNKFGAVAVRIYLQLGFAARHCSADRKLNGKLERTATDERST